MVAGNLSTQVAAPDAAETHYILIVHGTFNPPEPGQIKWYQPGGTFADALARQLRGTPLEGAVWRSHVGRAVFSWSGANDHAERLAAAAALCQELVALTDRDPTARVHFVAHSHGGNVVLAMLERYHAHLGRQAESARPAAGWPWVRGKAPHVAGVANDLAGALPDRHDFVTSGAHNRVGRLVFLGTPFYRKQWLTRSAGWFDYGVRLVTNAHVGLVWLGQMLLTAFMVINFFAAVTGSIMWLIGLGAQVRTFFPLDVNPLLWPRWVLYGCVALSGFTYLMFVSIYPFQNTNVYYNRNADGGFSHALRRNPGARLTRRKRTLVVTAGYLDEALAALWSEPFVLAHLVPAIDALLAGSRERAFWNALRKGRPLGERIGDALLALAPSNRELPIGINDLSISTMPFATAADWLVGRVVDLAYLLVWPLWAPYRAVRLKGRLTNTVLDLVGGAAYGLPARELRAARIGVHERPYLPDVLDVNADAYVDVSRLALQRAPAPEAAAVAPEAATRYAYLWDDTLLANKCAAMESAPGDNPWKKIVAACDTLFARYEASFRHEQPGPDPLLPRMNRKDFEAHLARIWFTAQERLKEITGAIELHHSLYYGNPEVVARIAAFLANEPPLR